jgi:hypothetical protein
MIKYKLTMIEEWEDKPAGHPLTRQHEVCCIGYFTSEKALVRWAEDSEGTLAKENADEPV